MQRLADLIQQLPGFMQRYGVGSGSRDALAKGSFKYLMQCRFAAGPQRVDEGVSSAVGVDGVVADLSFADVGASLHDQKTLLQQVGEPAVLVRCEQHGQPRGAATNQHCSELPFRNHYGPYPRQKK